MAVDDVAKQLSSRFSTRPPSVVVYKRHDPFHPYQVVPADKSPSLLAQALTEASLPVFAELTPVNFPAFFAKKNPFVLYFTKNPESPTFKALGTMARSKDFTSVIFSWLNLNSKDGLASKILAEYISHPTDDELVLVNHQLGTIHYFDEPVVDQPSLSKWVVDCLNGNKEPISVLEDKEWKPKNKGYDFLKFIDNDARATHVFEDRSEIDIANEHGIGFNKDGTLKLEESGQVYVKDELVSVTGAREDSENEIREELHNLRNSRLFHSKERSRHRQPGQDPGHHGTEHGEQNSMDVDKSDGVHENSHTEL